MQSDTSGPPTSSPTIAESELRLAALSHWVSRHSHSGSRSSRMARARSASTRPCGVPFGQMIHRRVLHHRRGDAVSRSECLALQLLVGVGFRSDEVVLQAHIVAGFVQRDVLQEVVVELVLRIRRVASQQAERDAAESGVVTLFPRRTLLPSTRNLADRRGRPARRGRATGCD